METLFVAIYHYQLKTISRSTGRTATASIAYRAGERIYDQRTGLTFDYSKRSGVILAEVFTPGGRKVDRETLWNAAELAEKRCNSVVAREIVLAIPHELNQAQQIQLVADYATGLSQRTGWAVDMAIHEPGREGDMRNVHAHLQCTTRSIQINPAGYPVMGYKTRNWDQRASGSELIRSERSEWERCVNQSLEMAQVRSRVDCRSHAEKGDSLQPQIHLGPSATQLERQGISTERGDINRDIAAHNAKIVELAEVREEKALYELLIELPSLTLSRQREIRDSYQPKSMEQLVEEDDLVKAEQTRLDGLLAEKELLEQALSHLEAERTDMLYQRELFNLTHPWLAVSRLPVPEIARINASLIQIEAEEDAQRQAFEVNEATMQECRNLLIRRREEAESALSESHAKQMERFYAVHWVVHPQEQAQRRIEDAEAMARWSRMDIETLREEAKRNSVWNGRTIASEYPEVQAVEQLLAESGPFGERQERKHVEALKQTDEALDQSRERVRVWREAHPVKARLYDANPAYPVGDYRGLLREQIQKTREQARARHALQQFEKKQAKANEKLEKAVQSVMSRAEKEARQRQTRHWSIQQVLSPMLERQRQEELRQEEIRKVVREAMNQQQPEPKKELHPEIEAMLKRDEEARKRDQGKGHSR
jgi:hypothetical protein